MPLASKPIKVRHDPRICSSTCVDLKEHRAHVGRLTATGIFVARTATCDETKELSMARVKDCHLCILLVEFRFGHVPTGEKRNITQMV